jgi:rhodanese-related sulfurtransferase
MRIALRPQTNGVLRVSDVGDVHIPAVSVDDTWAKLKSDAGAVLVDVRTIAEWAYVGLPDLSAIGKRPVLVEWQGFPDDRLNAAFVERLTEALAPLGADTGTEIFFICRSGTRSLRAAQAMAAAGYMRCRNVTDGFEGPLDPSRHRGQLGGWKAKGLPWTQG